MPKVSVIIPTFNRSRYICEAIDSVLAQTFNDYEIIVVDDGSTDNTKEVIEKYNGKIRYFYQENKGPSAARNMGIKASKGDYIAFLDSDDLWLNLYLEMCLVHLNSGNCDLVITDNYTDIYNENNKLLTRESCIRENYLGNESRLYKILFQRFQKGFAGEIRFIIKKLCLNKIGLFDEQIIIVEDWDLWLRIAKNNLKIGYIQEPLFIYRKHPTSLCRNKNNEKAKLINIYNVCRKNKKDAFRINKSLIKTYSQTLWFIGSESLVQKIGFYFGIKCILESLFYDFDIKKLFKLTMKYFLKANQSI